MTAAVIEALPPVSTRKRLALLKQRHAAAIARRGYPKFRVDARHLDALLVALRQPRPFSPLRLGSGLEVPHDA